MYVSKQLAAIWQKNSLLSYRVSRLSWC